VRVNSLACRDSIVNSMGAFDLCQCKFGNGHVTGMAIGTHSQRPLPLLSSPLIWSGLELAVDASPSSSPFAFSLPTITTKSSKWLPMVFFAPSNRINNEIDQIVVQTAECLASSISTMRALTPPARPARRHCAYCYPSYCPGPQCHTPPATVVVVPWIPANFCLDQAIMSMRPQAR